jgi:putative solute:sodium symporter small subunit
MHSSEHSTAARAYWRANLRLLAKLILIWAFVSFGLGIFLAGWLDQFRIGGYPLGFFFAQQGAIYVFIALIFVYVRRMNRLDRQFGVNEE